MTIQFGSGDGSELEFVFPRAIATKISLRSKAREHFHLSRIEVRTDAGWQAISGEVVRAAEMSSDNSAANGGSMSRFLKGEGFFETRADAAPMVSFDLVPTICDAIRLHNRSDGLWERAGDMVISVSFDDGEPWQFDCGSTHAARGYYLGRVREAHSDSVAPPVAEKLRTLESRLQRDADPGLLLEAVRSYSAEVLEWALSAGESQLPLEVDRQVRVVLAVWHLVKSHSGFGTEDVVQEFLSRILITTPRLAFTRLRKNPLALINNALYESLNAVLCNERLERRIGKLELHGHGLFQRRARCPDAVTLEFSSRVCALLDQIGIRSFVCYGALLGLVRENRLLPHDDDVDMLALIDGEAEVEDAFEKVSACLSKEGLRTGRNTTNTRRLPFITVSDPKNPVYLDVFFGWRSKEDGESLCLPMQKVQYGVVPFEYFGEGQTAIFHGAEVRVPVAPESFLERRYGSDWKTPDYLFRLREG
jgi:hypothetical protein